MVGSNHGGGCTCARSLPGLPTISHTPCVLPDLYSLCPSGEPLTERCFQQTPLPFVGSHHTIRYIDNGTEFPIPATDVSEGTWPKGSSWRVNPIPACNCDRGDACNTKNGTIAMQKAYHDDGPPVPKGDAGNGNDCPTGTQFPVPFPYGYGQHMWYNNPAGPSRDMWAIIDQVQVPNVTGDYVLRWRWVRVHLCLSLAWVAWR